MKKVIFIILFLTLIFGNFVFAQSPTEKLEIHFFWGAGCPHCAAEKNFLDEIEKKYPEVKINSYLATDTQYEGLLRELSREHNAEKYIGLVPLTFVGEDFFLGFDNPQGIGKEIEDSIQRQLYGIEKEPTEPKGTIRVPILGEIDVSKYSLPVLTVILGFLDGFNVCSLGALVLILGLVLAFRQRFKIIIFGGAFILTTTIVYGLLMFLWYQIFSFFSPYQRLMQVLVGVVAIGGGIYFFKEYLRFRKTGPICEIGGSKLISELTTKVQETLKNPKSILAVIGTILIFAALVTIVEFPCSAAVPVAYTGILAGAKLPFVEILLYIVLFLFFYMLDEIIVFLVAAFTMNIWLASKKFVTYFTLAEAIILIFLGLYYLFNLGF